MPIRCEISALRRPVPALTPRALDPKALIKKILWDCRLRVSRADLYFCFRSSKNASHISGVAHEFKLEGKVFPHNLVVGTGCFLRNRSRARWQQAERARLARRWRWR